MLFDSYDVNCGWTLKVIESEREYWYTVEHQMKLLVNSLAGKAEKFPASLNRFVLDYIDLLIQRTKSLQSYRIDGDELERSGIDRLSWDKFLGVTLYSTLGCLRWCEKHEVLPRSGRGLLRRWILDLEKRQEREIVTCDGIVHSFTVHEPPNKWSTDKEIHRNLRDLVAATVDEDADKERRMSDARHAVYEIESIILVSRGETRTLHIKFL